MDRAFRDVRKRFVITIVLVVVAVTGTLWAMLQWYSTTELSSPADIAEVHQSSQVNQALTQYIEDQKAYEAHFIALATEVKRLESERVVKALAVTSFTVLVAGTIMAVLVARRLTEPVAEAYRSQERFIQDAAHELRNPLAAMSVAIQQADAKTRKTSLYKTIVRQTKRLVGISEDLLYLEKRSGVQTELVNITELLYDVVEELQPIAAAKKVHVKVQADNDIHKKIYAGDYVRLVKNIIENAIKYSYDNTDVHISQVRDKRYITIVVADKGIGIPERDIAAVGERFFRASNTGATDGTGLGLAIVQKILNVYGGTKLIESVVDKGTTVTIRLPA